MASSPGHLEWDTRSSTVGDRFRTSGDPEKAFPRKVTMESSSPAAPTSAPTNPARLKRSARTPDLEQLRFILECFFLSFGPECPQLGRNHPNSDPEAYAAGRHHHSHHHRRRDSHDSGASLQQSTTTDDDSSADMVDHDALLREVLRFFEAGLEDHNAVVNRYRRRSCQDRVGSLTSPDEPEPHFPVGPWRVAECGICLETVSLYERPCCGFPACTPCLRRYYASRVRQNSIQIECCNVRCHQFVPRDEISARLPP